MAMASFFMGGHPGMADFTRFGDAFSEESNASDDGRMDNQNTPQFGENADTRDNQSYKPKDETKLAPLEVNADVRVYGRLSGVSRALLYTSTHANFSVKRPSGSLARCTTPKARSLV